MEVSSSLKEKAIKDINPEPSQILDLLKKPQKK